MFHGGGWLINDKSIMDQAAKYMASNGEYVVCNVDYRLLGDQGNTVTLNEIVNDASVRCFGSKTISRVTVATLTESHSPVTAPVPTLRPQWSISGSISVPGTMPKTIWRFSHRTCLRA
jgi:hypothetical protein